MKKILKPPCEGSMRGELWLGNIAAAKNTELLQANNIKNVLSVINVAEIEETNKVYQEIDIKHMMVNIEDEIASNISDHLLVAMDFIESGNFFGWTNLRVKNWKRFGTLLPRCKP